MSQRPQKSEAKDSAEKPTVKAVKAYTKKNLSDGKVETLTFKSRNSNAAGQEITNFPRIKEQIETYATMHHSTLTTIFKDGTMDPYAEIEPPDLIKGELGPNLVKERRYKLESSAMFNKHEAREKSKPMMFEVILSILSDESETVLKKQPSWARIFSSKCPLELWKLIETTHQIAQSGLPAEDRWIANMYYVMQKMRVGESLPDFRKRYIESLKQRKAAGCADIEDEDDAFHFISTLAPPYNRVRKELTNYHHLGIGVFPTTSAEAYTVVSNYSFVSENGVLVSTEEGASTERQTMFSTLGNSPVYSKKERQDFYESQKPNVQHHAEINRAKRDKKKKKKSPKKEKLESSGSEDSSSSGSTRPSKSTGSKSTSSKSSRSLNRSRNDPNCFRCNRPGHVRKECYSGTKVGDDGVVIGDLKKRSRKDVGMSAVGSSFKELCAADLGWEGHIGF